MEFLANFGTFFVVALVAIRSGRAARLTADACLVFYFVNTHYTALFGTMMDVNLLRFVKDLEHMGSSFAAEVNLLVTASLVALVFLHRALYDRLRGLVTRRPRASATALGLTALAGLSLHITPFPTRFQQFRVNPVEAVVVSAFDHLGHEQPGEVVTTFQPTSPFPRTPPAAPQVGRTGPRPLNVVLVQMESTGSVAMNRPGAQTMPVFDSLRETGIYWTDFYASNPATIKTFYSLQCGVYPAADARPITEQNPRVPCKALAEHFKDHGYRTAFMHGGNFAFTHKLAFLVDRGWDVLLDAKTLPGRQDYERQTWGIDDEAVYEATKAWIDESDQPFLVLIAPILPHHPYHTPERWETPFPVDDKLYRYHNSLYFEDELIGDLVAHLKRTGRYEDTVFVLVGDHGQAFNQHPFNHFHPVQIYEENVKIPLLISNPRLSPEAQEIDTEGILPDLLPTLLDTVGFGLDDYDGDGVSLLDPPPDRVVYFHTTFDESMDGLRDGRFKFIHRLGTGQVELYDLSVDPNESRNLAADHPDRVAAYRQLTDRWHRYTFVRTR